MREPRPHLVKWRQVSYQVKDFLTSSLIFSILSVTQLLLLCSFFSSEGFLLLWQLEQLILVTRRLDSLVSDIWLSSEVVKWFNEVAR